jgi:nicotinamidase-related amidase
LPIGHLAADFFSPYPIHIQEVFPMQKTTALLLIDLQNDYFPGGSMELVGAGEAGRRSAAVLRGFRARHMPVMHIAHESVRQGATFFLSGTAGQRIHDLVQPGEEEMVVTKHFPNSFLKTPLLDMLRRLEVTHLVIAGMMTHMCVDATVRAATDLGFACTLVHDATATRDLSFAGKKVPAVQVQAAFTAALANLCEAVKSADEVVLSLEKAG